MPSAEEAASFDSDRETSLRGVTAFREKAFNDWNDASTKRRNKERDMVVVVIDLSTKLGDFCMDPTPEKKCGGGSE